MPLRRAVIAFSRLWRQSELPLSSPRRQRSSHTSTEPLRRRCADAAPAAGDGRIEFAEPSRPKLCKKWTITPAVGDENVAPITARAKKYADEFRLTSAQGLMAFGDDEAWRRRHDTRCRAVISRTDERSRDTPADASSRRLSPPPRHTPRYFETSLCRPPSTVCRDD